MKIAIASDIHGKWNGLDWPKADVLVLAGDILPNHSIDPWNDSLRQEDSLKNLDYHMGILRENGTYEDIILVAGNHDWIFQHRRKAAEAAIIDMIYLQDESVTINGVKFYGSPWQPWFYNWAFNFPNPSINHARARAHARNNWDNIPEDTNVLITHGPPKGILDMTDDLRHVGCDYLKQRLRQLEDLKLHAFGHIHSSYGMGVLDGVHFVNGAICTEAYKPLNAVQVVEI